VRTEPRKEQVKKKIKKVESAEVKAKKKAELKEKWEAKQKEKMKQDELEAYKQNKKTKKDNRYILQIFSRKICASISNLTFKNLCLYKL